RAKAPGFLPTFVPIHFPRSTMTNSRAEARPRRGAPIFRTRRNYRVWNELEALEARALMAVDFQSALGLGASIRPLSVAVDSTGASYVTGNFQGPVDFDPGAGTTNLASNNDSRDLFVAKYSPTGALVWAFNLGDNGFDQGLAIATDNNNNVYVAGEFSGTIDFDRGPGTTSFTADQRFDGFVMKLDTNGNFVYATNIHTAFHHDVIPFSIKADNAGNAYLTGTYENLTSFGPFNLTAAGDHDAFVTKLGPTGNFVWARDFAATPGHISEGHG